MKIGKFKIKRVWLIVIIIILAIIGYYVVKSFLKNPADGYVTEIISKGQVAQEISETGSVKATEDFSMSFKGVGRISKINVSVGEEVKKGDILAELDLAQISAQLQSAQAALSAARSQYEKSQTGSGAENLKASEQSLETAYVTSQNAVNDAYTKIYGAYSAVLEIQDSYFTPPYDIRNIAVAEAKLQIYNSMQKAKESLDNMKSNASEDNISIALSQTISSLENIKNNLRIVREECDKTANTDVVPVATKTTLDTHRASIDTAMSSVTSAQQNISSLKISLQKTQLGSTEDSDIYLSQVEQAQANVDLYQSQLNDNYIRSPIDGKITDILAKRGETVSPNAPIINLLSTEPFQIKVNIYEQDIVNVKVGNSVKIELVAFPKQIFEGKVLSINPAEKIVDNVVYYEVTIDFPGQPEGVKSGMTADVTILTNEKNEVVRVPKIAVESADGKELVQVVSRGKIENREIKIGLEGNDYYEVASGLNEGDEIIIGQK